MADFNLSFDDIDSDVLVGEEEINRKVIYQTTVRKITFNPRSTTLAEVTSKLLPNTAKPGGGVETGSLTQYRQPATEGYIYSATDLGYYSVDPENRKRTDVTRTKKMDGMNEQYMMEQGSSGAAKRARPDPLEDANSISKLARIYDDKVKETRAAKGLE